MTLFQLNLQFIDMMSPDQTLGVDTVMLWSFKLLFIVLAILFVIISFVSIRQVKVMNDTVSTVLGPLLRIITIGIFILSIVLLIAAFTLL